MTTITRNVTVSHFQRKAGGILERDLSLLSNLYIKLKLERFITLNN